MDIIKNYGILASVSWNSNKWAGDPTFEDVRNSKYGYVKENHEMHESVNFGHDKFPAEDDGYYIAYSPMFNTLPDVNKSQNVKVLFLFSSDYRNENRKCIIGIYAYPEFKAKYDRNAEEKLFKKYNWGNIRAYPENIIYFDVPVIINRENVRMQNFLPEGKGIGQQGFNYLNSDNVLSLLVNTYKENPNNKKLFNVIKNFPLEVNYTAEICLINDVYYLLQRGTSDTLAGIKRIEMMMKGKKPELKERLSSYIERGSIATKVKAITGYKCLICEQLKLPVFSFRKKDGKYYVEAHHVEPVSTLNIGVLSITNIITVCPNHHRQLHYGDANIIDQTDKEFTFKIEDQIINVNKVSFS